MKFDENLSTIHGYLCSDGYVVKNEKGFGHKFYAIGFRNTNPVLLKDFQQRFTQYFGKTPSIYRDGRSLIRSKPIYYQLTKDFSYYSAKWSLPKLSKKLLSIWLRAYFDCDGWVELQKAKSRSIRIDSINLKGLREIQSALNTFEITSTIKKRRETRHRLTIAGLDDLRRFQKLINFLHPAKRKTLDDALNSYQNYNWTLPTSRSELINFIRTKGRISRRDDRMRFFSVLKSNLIKLQRILRKHSLRGKIYGPYRGNTTRYYYLGMKLQELERLLA